MLATTAALFAPGFFSSAQVHTALAIGTPVAVVAGVLGVFTVIRGQAFAGHALSDIGASGGSASFLLSIGPLWGFLPATLAAAAAMELIGIQRPRGRDVATGIVFGASLGLAALFLYLDATYHNSAGATVTILFGSLFAIDPSTVPAVVILSVCALGLISALSRPLLISSLSPDLAAARGIPVRLVGAAYLVALAVSMALAALTIGAILGTALLIGPAAAALRIVRRPGYAVAVAAGLGVAITWLSVVLAYDSFDWPPHGHAWPVSFFVVTASLGVYLLAALFARRSAAGGA